MRDGDYKAILTVEKCCGATLPQIKSKLVLTSAKNRNKLRIRTFDHTADCVENLTSLHNPNPTLGLAVVGLLRIVTSRGRIVARRELAAPDLLARGAAVFSG